MPVSVVSDNRDDNNGGDDDVVDVDDDYVNKDDGRAEGLLKVARMETRS